MEKQETEEFKEKRLRECLIEQGLSNEALNNFINFSKKRPKADFSISCERLFLIIDEAIKFGGRNSSHA